MGTFSFVDSVIRLVVAAAAGLFAIPLVIRSAKRWVTAGLLAAGILLVLTPVVLPLIHRAINWPGGQLFAVLARLDAAGFAVILLGVFRGLRALRDAGDRLAAANLVLKEQASIDALTGLLNRREADSLLEYGAVRARESKAALGFVMIDLDFFKHVNDSRGHAAGDAVLAHIGRLLRGELRSSDIVARYGGEEFLVVVSESHPQKIIGLAENLRRVIEQTPAAFEGQTIPMTASLGVAVSPVGADETVKEAIRKADAALYKAKAAGRNRVVAWDESVTLADDAGRSLRIA